MKGAISSMSEGDAANKQGNAANDGMPRSGRPPERLSEIQREWLGFKDLSRYAALSEKTLRSWVYSPVDPLPAAKVCGKVLVRKSVFDAYLERHKVKRLEEIDVDTIVRDVLNSDGGQGGR
jgi:hypothetical protein